MVAYCWCINTRSSEHACVYPPGLGALDDETSRCIEPSHLLVMDEARVATVYRIESNPTEIPGLVIALRFNVPNSLLRQYSGSRRSTEILHL